MWDWGKLISDCDFFGPSDDGKSQLPFVFLVLDLGHTCLGVNCPLG